MAAGFRALAAVSLLVLTGTVARAVEVENLYGAQAIVTGTEEPERTRGFRAGLTDLVVKLTGDARLAESDRLRPLLESPQRFVDAFEYEDRMKGIPVHDEQGTRERPHFLRMRFKQSDVDAALAKLGLSKWPADRPLLAVWLGVRTAAGAYVLTALGAEGYGQRLVIVETAVRRGIPVLLPEAGATATVAFDDVGAGNVSKMTDASPRADAMLSGVLSSVPDGYWDMEWRLTQRDRSRSWRLSKVSFDTALKNGLETSALILSGKAPF
jgi:hypothetical protein